MSRYTLELLSLPAQPAAAEQVLRIVSNRKAGDLDRFKAVNDELGHETGDAVPVPDVLDARRLAEDMREHIALRCNALLPPDWGLTAAIGVAVFPDAAVDPESLMRAADIALYRAKDLANDGVVVAESGRPAEVRARRPKVRRGLVRRR